MVGPAAAAGRAVSTPPGVSPGESLVALVPILLFSLTYASTCLIGAVLLLADYRPYAALFEYFSGFHAPGRPDLAPLQLTLLFLAPIAMWFGYVAGLRAPLFGLARNIRIKASSLAPPTWLPQLVFYALAAVAFNSLTEFGSLGDVRAWLDPQSWMEARYRAFREVSFFGFVNVYTLVPLTAAWVVLTSRGVGVSASLRRWLPLFCALAVSILLYQKRPALIVLALVLSASVIALQRAHPRRAQLLIAAGSGASLLLYLSLVMIPAYFETRVELSRPRPSSVAARVTTNADYSDRRPSTAQPDAGLMPPATPDAALSAPAPTPNAEYPVTPELGAQPPAATAPAAITEGGKTQSVLLYALLGPLNRTSASALYYTVVFPDIHPFYGLDFGQDMLGKLPWFDFGRMPDDNIVVWDYMAPSMPGGRVAAPFQFVLYSQVGLMGALVGSGVLGMLLALAWRCVQDRRVPTVWASLAGALVLLLSVFLAMDSPRNSLLVSYGVFWGFLFLGAAMAVVALLNRLKVASSDLVVRIPGPVAGKHNIK